MAQYHTPVHSGPYGEPEDDLLNEHVQDPGDPDGVIAAEKLRQWNEAHPHPQVVREEPERKRRWPAVLAVVVILAAATAGAYWLGTQRGTRQQAANTSSSQRYAKQQPAAVPIASQTKHYDSTGLALSFDYPANWTVSDTAGKLTVTSQPVSLMTAVGSKTNASVVVTMQGQQTNIAGFPAGGAVASLASDLIKYTKPSSVQRAQSYLSYLSYTGPKDLDALYLTGDKVYQQGQAVPMSDVAAGNPLISAGFVSSSGSSDFVTLQASSWKSSPAAQAVVNLLESIVINN